MILGGATFLYFNILKDDEEKRERIAKEKEERREQLLKEEETRREQQAKEEEARRQLDIAARRDLIIEIDSLFRSTKHIKRTLRSRSVITDGRLFIDKIFFENSLDEIDRIQIGLEQNRETIKIRIELLSDVMHENILAALSYVTRYLHDVFEDFEKRRVFLDGNSYVISGECKNLLDFLSSGEPPASIKEQVAIMRNREKSNSERWTAFHKIRCIRRKTDRRRFRAVAEGCLDLAASDVKSIEKFTS